MKISDRLTVNLGTRYTLNFPSTEAHEALSSISIRKCSSFPTPPANLSTAISNRASVWRTDPVFRGWCVPVKGSSGSNRPESPRGSPCHNFHSCRRWASNPQQWNFTLQKTFARDFNFEIGYLGSKNTHLGLPEANLNQLPARYLAMGAALTDKVANPYYGQVPASSSLGQPSIAQQQLLRAFPRFTNVALFRDNVGDSEYEAVQAKLEKRLSRGITFSWRTPSRS